MDRANGRRRCCVTTCLTGQVHAQNDPFISVQLCSITVSPKLPLHMPWITCKNYSSNTTMITSWLNYSNVHIYLSYMYINIFKQYSYLVITALLKTNSSCTTCWWYSILKFLHDDVIKWRNFHCYWPFVRGIHRSPVNSPHKGQWRGALMLSLICASINGWVNNGETSDVRRYRIHYNVIVMVFSICRVGAKQGRSLFSQGDLQKCRTLERHMQKVMI